MFPDATLYTLIYSPETTFSDFKSRSIKTAGLIDNRATRKNHVSAFPFVPLAVARRPIECDLLVASSSGWAHAFPTTGKKLIYCHTPARWLYAQREAFMGHPVRRGTLQPILNRFEQWDREAALAADAYVANSTATQRRIRAAYGIDAEIIHPPVEPIPNSSEVRGGEPGRFLCVSRLQSYKNVGAVAEAFRLLPEHSLDVVGDGPLLRRLRSIAPPNVRFWGPVSETTLHELYGSAHALVAASFEDFGLTPVEAASAGKPSVVLRAGGYLDSMTPDTAEFFDSVDPVEIAAAVRRASVRSWDPSSLRAHSETFAEATFHARLGEKIHQLVGNDQPVT